MAWLVHNAMEGNAANARARMEEEFSRLFQLMFVEGNPAGVKCMLNIKGMVKNVLRLPLVPVSEHVSQQIQKELAKFS